MNPQHERQLIGLIGLASGFGLYALAGRLAEPWQSVVIGLMFALLGAAAWAYAKGERWIRLLAGILLAYALFRVVFPFLSPAS